MLESINLNYGYSELEPYIDTHTVGLHYKKHYLGYLKKLNELLKKYNIQNNEDINTLLNKITLSNSDETNDILFNLGGVLNHELYFNSISDNPKNENSNLIDAINNKYGNFNNFKKEFTNEAMKLKGSGYTFLTIDKNGNLDIINLPNQHTPYLYGLVPLLTIDLWEHAYYINYQNRKKDYIDNFFEIIDLSNASKIYDSYKVI